MFEADVLSNEEGMIPVFTSPTSSSAKTSQNSHDPVLWPQPLAIAESLHKELHKSPTGTDDTTECVNVAGKDEGYFAAASDIMTGEYSTGDSFLILKIL